MVKMFADKTANGKYKIIVFVDGKELTELSRRVDTKKEVTKAMSDIAKEMKL